MRVFYRWIPILLTSITIALVVSLFPHFADKQTMTLNHNPQLQGPSASEAMSLTTGNLVDQFTQLALHHQLDRIDWNGSMLQVEMFIEKSPIVAQDIYEDLFTLAQFSFSQANNVDTLWIRLLSKEGKKWVLVMKASKSAWNEDDASEVVQDIELLESYLKQRFQIITSATDLSMK